MPDALVPADARPPERNGSAPSGAAGGAAHVAWLREMERAAAAAWFQPFEGGASQSRAVQSPPAKWPLFEGDLQRVGAHRRRPPTDPAERIAGQPGPAPMPLAQGPAVPAATPTTTSAPGGWPARPASRSVGWPADTASDAASARAGRDPTGPGEAAHRLSLTALPTPGAVADPLAPAAASDPGRISAVVAGTGSVDRAIETAPARSLDVATPVRAAPLAASAAAPAGPSREIGAGGASPPDAVADPARTTAIVRQALAATPPVRLHVESAAGMAQVWIGLDAALADALPALVERLAHDLQRARLRLRSVVCNGRPVGPAPGARPTATATPAFASDRAGAAATPSVAVFIHLVQEH